MGLIDKAKIYGKAAKKAIGETVPKKAAKPKPDLKQVVDPVRRVVLENGADIGKQIGVKLAKSQRNKALGISREGGQAIDDLIDLGKKGEEVMSRRTMLKQMMNRAKKHNPPKVLDKVTKPVIEKLPKFSIVSTNAARFSASYRLKTGLLGKHP
jgi:hypothetical protein